MKKRTVYSIVAAIVILFSSYGILVTWRPHSTEGLFKFDCCAWTEDKPKKKVKE